MRELKNCPNCGGILDESGRCAYCKSKVYDLSDIKIDPYNHAPLYLQVTNKDGKIILMKCYTKDLAITCGPSVESEAALTFGIL